MIKIIEIDAKKNKLKASPSQVLVLGFGIIIILGAILLNLPIASSDDQSVGFVNALFTATSAVCVTGLVVVDTATHWSAFGQVVIITLVQTGELGFMTMSNIIDLIIGHRINLRKRSLCKMFKSRRA